MEKSLAIMMHRPAKNTKGIGGSLIVPEVSCRLLQYAEKSGM